MAILGMVNWIYKWYRKSGKNSIEEIGDIFIDLILHAVLKTEFLDTDRYQASLIKNPFFIDF